MAWNPIFSKCCCWRCILLPNRPPALQVAAPLPGAGCWYRCRACQSIKAARSAALAARIKSDLKQPNRKSSGARLPRLRQSALDGKKVMGARQFQSPWDLPSETPQGKGVHPEKGMRGDASCRQSRDRYNPYRLRYGHARFFVPFFPLFIIIAYLSLPAQGVYIFYNSWFRFLGETSIPHTFSWEESPCIKRLDSPSLQSYIPPVFRQTESPVLEITTLRLLLLFTRTSELITVTHRKPCPPCPTVSPGHDKCDKINWYTDIVSSIAYTALPSLLQSTIPIVHHMIRRNSNAVTVNMGRGAYDTTGTLKPGQPPPPKPR